MRSPAPARPRPRPALVRGLAPRFALIIGDPRLASAVHVSCVDDTIDVHYPESRITCRLRRLPLGDRLLCAFRVTHLALDGSAEECHHVDLTLGGDAGPAAQREAVLRHLHAFRCAAAASRVRLATRVHRTEALLRRPHDPAFLAAA
ncbi:hypothetical protein ACH5A2_40485 [Streptomyces collinus]|uniref:hypothetical protein n=1 Tax=Streptomyces collinus TaxID=42684 RepID=UPI0037B6E499